jgi:hypothetical protein
MMETIDDIVREMRKRFEPYAKSDSNDARYVAYLGYAEFADRIEKAVTNCNHLETVDIESRCIYGEVKEPTCDKSSQVGNVAKMRDVLRKMREFMDDVNHQQNPLEYGQYCWAVDIIDTALSAPPRNCDLYATEVEAYRGWERYYNSIDKKDGYLDYEDWLFAKSKPATANVNLIV